MKKLSRRYICVGCIVILIILFYAAMQKVVFVTNREFYNGTMGIIDTSLTEQYDNVIFSGKVTNDNSRSHGDSLVSFLRDSGYNDVIYYYSAINEENKITSQTILNGLEWMKERGVKRINLSLSTCVYNQDIASWIKNNQDIQIYASYSNLKNSIDYPAMYEDVVGCGFLNGILYKEKDVVYESNKLIICNDKIRYYNGTSYLSLYTMITQ